MIFAFTYLSSTIGVLAVGFAVAEYESSYAQKLTDELIYKEFSLGNALSDYRGKRIEIHKTLTWFPLIEWQIRKEHYSSYLVLGEPLKIDYNPVSTELYLSSKKTYRDSTFYWNDTIRIIELSPTSFQ